MSNVFWNAHQKLKQKKKKNAGISVEGAGKDDVMCCDASEGSLAVDVHALEGTFVSGATAPSGPGPPRSLGV
jgi:hypothetical protein